MVLVSTFINNANVIYHTRYDIDPTYVKLSYFDVPVFDSYRLKFHNLFFRNHICH